MLFYNNNHISGISCDVVRFDLKPDIHAARERGELQFPVKKECPISTLRVSAPPRDDLPSTSTDEFRFGSSGREQAVDGENGNDSALYGDDVRDRQFCAILHRFKAVRGNVADAQNLVHQNAGGRPFEDR